MDADRWQRIARLYNEALLRPAPERDAFLDASCGGDDDLRHEVESLLRQETSVESFLAMPAEGDGVGLEPGVRLGVYRIERSLGRGGMGLVFLAHDTTLHRQVALKVLGTLPHDGTDHPRLLREARNAAALNHPNICTVYALARPTDVRSLPWSTSRAGR